MSGVNRGGHRGQNCEREERRRRREERAALRLAQNLEELNDFFLGESPRNYTSIDVDFGRFVISTPSSLSETKSLADNRGNSRIRE